MDHKKFNRESLREEKNSGILGVPGKIILKRMWHYYQVMYKQLHRLCMLASGTLLEHGNRTQVKIKP
jgi:hypothetical protein